MFSRRGVAALCLALACVLPLAAAEEEGGKKKIDTTIGIDDHTHFVSTTNTINGDIFEVEFRGRDDRRGNVPHGVDGHSHGPSVPRARSCC